MRGTWYLTLGLQGTQSTAFTPRRPCSATGEQEMPSEGYIEKRSALGGEDKIVKDAEPESQE